MIELVFLFLIPAAIGVLSGMFIKKTPYLFAICIPALLGLAYIIFEEYILPYQGGGASFFPITLVGSIVYPGFIGFTTCMIVKAIKDK